MSTRLTLTIPKLLYRTLLISLAVVSTWSITVAPLKVSAQEEPPEQCDERVLKDLQVAMINCSGESAPKPCTTGGPAAGGGTLDYAGNPILTQAQTEAIAQNQAVYQEAAKQVDIPWQMIAVIHLQETGLKLVNPGNGQGIYQFVNGNGGPYPAGPVNDAEFLRQTVLAAQFIKGKANANYPPNRTLTAAGSTPDAVKDTFYSYNGRAPQYAQQAASKGFDPNTQGFEGSPYVMTKADAARDPAANPTSWGQIKRDFGPLEYPANSTYGAFVIYGALAGISGTCGAAGAGTFVWPEAHSTTISSCFGERNDPLNPGRISNHPGLDIVGGAGTPILAAAGGTVTNAGPVSGYGNNFVAIKHNNGFGTSYGHMESMSVRVGDIVTPGQQIGTEGTQGGSTGSHLHFNVFPDEYKGSDGPNVDPLQNGLTIPPGVTNPNNCN